MLGFHKETAKTYEMSRIGWNTVIYFLHLVHNKIYLCNFHRFFASYNYMHTIFQEWKMREDGEKTAVYNMAAGLCLTPEAEKIGMKVEMQVCSDKSHLWTMIDVENKVSEL